MLARHFITFPQTPAEILQTQADLYNVANFPRAVGLIDCTHIKIISPGKLDFQILLIVVLLQNSLAD